MQKVTFKTVFICIYKGGAQKYEKLHQTQLINSRFFAPKKCVCFFEYNSDVFRPIFKFRVSIESWLRGECDPNFSRRYDTQESRYKRLKLFNFM